MPERLPLPGTGEKWPHFVNIDAAIDQTRAELDGGSAGNVTSNGAANNVKPLDAWIAQNGERYNEPDDDQPALRP